MAGACMELHRPLCTGACRYGAEKREERRETKKEQIEKREERRENGEGRRDKACNNKRAGNHNKMNIEHILGN